MPDFVTIKNITATPIRVGSQTVAGSASATVDVLDQKTARDLESNSGFFVITSGTGGSSVITPSDTTPAMDGVAAAGVSTLYSRGDHIHPTDTSRAPLSNPVFTGDPQAPTPLTADNDTSIATTAFVKAQTYAPLASPVFTGDPQAPTPITADNDTSIATTAFVKAQSYAPLANPVFTGDPQAPTPASGDNDTSVATTAFVKAQAYATLASPTFTGDPQAPTASAGDNDTTIATTAFVQAALNALIPPGVMVPYGSSTAPTGWINCDGLAVNRVGAFANLFAAIGTTFGVGDGSTTFNVPNLKGRSPIGFGTGDATDATAHAMGSKTGTETYTLGLTEIPAHDHSPTANGLTGSTTPGVTGGPSTANTGAGTSHTHGVGTMVANANALVTASGGTSANSGRLSVDNSQGGAVVVGNYAGADLGITGAMAAEATHTHSLSAHTHTSAAHTHSLSSVGGGSAHPNMQPSLTVNYIIKT